MLSESSSIPLSRCVDEIYKLARFLIIFDYEIFLRNERDSRLLRWFLSIFYYDTVLVNLL